MLADAKKDIQLAGIWFQVASGIGTVVYPNQPFERKQSHANLNQRLSWHFCKWPIIKDFKLDLWWPMEEKDKGVLRQNWGIRTMAFNFFFNSEKETVCLMLPTLTHGTGQFQSTTLPACLFFVALRDSLHSFLALLQFNFKELTCQKQDWLCTP